MTNEKIIRILCREYDMEMKCAKTCKAMIKKTLNPIRRARLHSDYRRHLEHCFGINLARMHLIMEMEKEP